MTEEPSLVAPPPQVDEQTDSVRDAFAQLYADGRAYADAEIERQKLRAGIAGAGVRDAVIFGAAGVMLAFAGLVALLVGLILLLSPQVGPGWATAIVFGASLLIALALLLVAKSRITRMKKAIGS
ncbi:MAG TPA: phage holin family protein [Sphingobium sp.]|nr:phage holin family protein [Sphingobium sp.]